MSFNISSMNHKLSKPIKIKLGVLILISIVTFLILILIFTLILIFFLKRRKNKSYNCSMDLPKNNVDEWDIEMGIGTCAEKDIAEPVGSDSGPVIKYLLKDIDLATNGLTYDNLIWSGKTGKVFDGFLNDGSRVAVQNFSTSLGVKGFGEEAEAMCLIRHKNLVKILGYCDEGIYRMLVYEHVENGNLNHWLHQNKEYPSPLSWNIRLHIIKGIANGLAYLHQDIKPAVVHPDLKSINILLDENWNPKITNFAMARLLSPAIAPSTRMHALVNQPYAYHARRTRVLDVYSFGILIMEIISGKTTTFSTTTVTEIEENLVHWIKCKFDKRKFGEILDPRLPEFPSQMEMIEQIVGIALECVDSEVHERPKMGKIIRTLEKSIEKIQTLPLSDEHVMKRIISRRISSKELCYLRVERSLVQKLMLSTFALAFGAAGLGITVFGMAYMIVHDGLVHRRFPVGPIAHVPYLRSVAAAHQLHHSNKFHGVPYGLFLGPKELEEVGGLAELDKEINRRIKLAKNL